MTKITDQEGRTLELLLDNYGYASIATADFSPSEDPSLSAVEIAQFCDQGFFVMPHADGTFYGITWRDYHANGDSVTGLTPKIYKGFDGQWIPCRYVKVYAHDDATYVTVATTINYSIPC